VRSSCSGTLSSPWVLASRNEGKLVELRALFATVGINVIDLREAGVPENAEAEADIESFGTFEENALAKARFFAARLPAHSVVADDSGLSVDALGGAPGVRSKRWAGRGELHGSALDAANNACLVAAMRGQVGRGARFVCAAAWSNGRADMVSRGEVSGHIVDTPAGVRGFGYDPHVVVDELGMTLAEATIEEKQRVSHRARAFMSLVRVLRAGGRIE
jgi:XTP/dITP diphosphohydrolase